MNPHQVTRDFEAGLCAYTGASHAVAVSSCTMALLLACAWHLRAFHPLHRSRGKGAFRSAPEIEIPRFTYVSVPMSILHAGGRPTFRDDDWHGMYQLKPYPIWDSARWFTKSLFGAVARETPKAFVCVSFHASKTLGIEQGGAILHNDPEADPWLRKARFDGRTEGVAPKDDKFDLVGWHCYLNPSTAAQGLLRLHSLPDYNPTLPNDPYPDLSQMEIFR